MTYAEVLKSVDYPTEVLILDFETFFDQDYSLSKMSTIEHICDSRFEFTGCGFAILNSHYEESPFFINKPGLDVYIKSLQQVFGKNLERVTVVAKNCKFDITILVKKFGINPPHIIDIDDLLRYYDARMSHRMKDVAPMFELQPKGDTNQFKGLHYEQMSTSIRENLAIYCKNDVEIEISLFTTLLLKLTNPAIEIPVARHTLDLYLRPNFDFDFHLGEELSSKMLSEMDKMADKTSLTKKQLSGNLEFVKALQRAIPGQLIKIPVKPGKPGKNMIKLLGQSGVIPAFAKDDVGFQELLVHPDLNVRSLCIARQAVKSWPLHIKRITNMAAQANCCNGKLPVALHYYGGHTGRWSGGEKINLQNLGGQGRAGQGTHPLIQQMRALLKAPKGYILGITDSAQIEARILAWLAGQDDLVKGFANGEDIYSHFATELFKCLVYKPKKDDPPPVTSLLKIRRGFGKDTILGCGFGLGSNTFYGRCLSNQDLRPYFDSGEYDWDFIDNLIHTYRTKYSKIPEFWKAVEKAFKWVIKYPHEVVRYGSIKTPPGMSGQDCFGHDFPLLGFCNDNGTVHIRLPSGRELLYRHCALKYTTKGSQIRWHWGHLWGGSITENIVQSVARDLLAWWILEMEKQDLNVIHHSHDEIICMLEKGKGKVLGFEVIDGKEQLDLQFMLEIMRTGPNWAEGLPLDAEGCLSECYKK